MISLTHIPRPPLTELVDLFWLVDSHEVPHEKERVLPNGCMQIILSLRDNGFRVYDRAHHGHESRLSGSILTGPSSEFSIINTADVISTIGVCFKPGGARPLFGLRADEMYDQDADLDTLWGASATSELRERILAADSPDAKFRVLEDILLARACWEQVRHPAVAFALRAFDRIPHTRTIGDVTTQVGLSRRRLIELFRETIGLTPKRFCRLRRFQEVLGLVCRGQPVDWAEIASACGYFDQAHLIHDFRAFSGLTPSEYTRLRTAHQNHVLLE
ncbi:MAG: helix-turn-helix domain-containing protein [Luteitalea sp.]|nr:helix-turn-helix domain-containing protein [Luteitalea sp.]